MISGIENQTCTKMADEERDQEKNKNKRVRDEDGDVDRDRLDTLPSFKKIHIHYSKPEDDLTTLGAYSSSSDDSNSPNEAGVFDFPWLKEGTTMKSDLNFEDAFASSLDATNVSEMFEADVVDKLIVTEKCGSQEAEEKDNRVSVYRGSTAMSRKKEEEEEDDGLGCVWDSLLNQKPLSNIEFEAGGGF
ncbi:hypothetical protein QQ045_029542 [Rhodiola kirilowii]